MQIATLSAQPRRRSPHFPVAHLGERLQVLLEAPSSPQRERLEAVLAGLSLRASLDWVVGDAGSVESNAKSPSVRVSSRLESELELCATTRGSQREFALVFELVQALAEASFGVHVTFAEPSARRRPLP